MIAGAELRRWARRLVEGDTIADKLAVDGAGWVDLGALPDQPGRPATLQARSRARFPGVHELGAADARATVLHFFANHELLALELMARALLGFPEAPPAFHAGLAGVIRDEQRHLAMYLDRMAAAGLPFGAVPVNMHFWDALAPIDDPLRFISGISLVFEQANLDFAAQYAVAFRDVGDLDTAAALDEVLLDEIRHVRHGLSWFDRWRTPHLTRWEAWQRSLNAPLSPARARGPVFARSARERAGLDADFIDRLAVWGGSKGRPPAVWSFEPGVEAAVAGEATPPIAEQIAADLDPVLMLLAAREDVVLVRRPAPPALLEGLAAVGVPLSEPVTGGEDALRGRVLGPRRPWGQAPGSPGWSPAWRSLYSKAWAAEQARGWPDLTPADARPEVVHDASALAASIRPGAVLKAPFGTAGRGMRRAEAPDAARWAAAVLRAQGAVVVEPWLDKCVDLSVQFDVDGDGVVRVDRWGRFLTDARGAWIGAVVGDATADLPAEVRAVLAAGVQSLREVARRLGAAMHALGYAGPAGIDAMVYRSADGPRLRPLVELNPRNTMGRAARALDRRVRPGRVGLWRQVSLRAVRAAGHAGFATWAAGLRARHPLGVTAGRVDRGVLFTTWPETAVAHVLVLAVGDSLADASAMLELELR